MKIIMEGYIFDIIENRPSSHSVSLCKISNTEIFAAWFSGTSEGNKDVDIFYSIYDINKAIWSVPKILVKDAKRSLGNTVPVVINNALRVYFCAMEGKNWSESTLWYIESHDGGKTWGEKQLFIGEYNWLFGTKILKLKHGEWIFPLYNEKLWFSKPLFTIDIFNNRWEDMGEIKTKRGNIQPDMVELEDHILCLLRTRDGFVYKTIYSFEKNSWSDPISTGIPNPNSRVALEWIDDKLICCCNPIGLKDSPWSKRNILSIFVSKDQGETWKEELVLEKSEDETKEYSYPWIQKIDKKRFMIAYTYERKKIKYVILENA